MGRCQAGLADLVDGSVSILFFIKISPIIPLRHYFLETFPSSAKTQQAMLHLRHI
jgi:hypothetical protein